MFFIEIEAVDRVSAEIEANRKIPKRLKATLIKIEEN
jgi:hypothetical protein